MKRILVAGILAGVAALTSSAAFARVDVGIGIGIPGVVVAAPPPVYYEPAPVYMAPPPPVVVAPRPVVVAPGYGYYDGWRGREWREHEWREHERRREWHRWHEDRDD